LSVPLFENVPADGLGGCQLEETAASVRRRFWGSSSQRWSAIEICRNLSKLAPRHSGYSLNNILSAAFPARLASVMDSK
jgi:hypothetical protein